LGIEAACEFGADARPDTLCQIPCRIALETDRQNPLRLWTEACLKEKGGALREHFRFARTWTGDKQTIRSRADSPVRVWFQAHDTLGKPSLWFDSRTHLLSSS
jgi:hypothetical protein